DHSDDRCIFNLFLTSLQRCHEVSTFTPFCPDCSPWLRDVDEPSMARGIIKCATLYRSVGYLAIEYRNSIPNQIPSSIRGRTMNEVEQLIATIKRQLKAQGLTYRDVAQALALSEASVKRLFASERLNLDRLAQIAALLGFTLAELTQEAAAALPVLRGLA